LLPAALYAGAIAQASLSVALQYPDAINNVFGFSGPSTSFPNPVTDEIPDGVVHQAKQAAISAAQQSPRVYIVTAAPGDVETTNDGDATATIDGSVFGSLENLTANPVPVTFSFNVDASSECTDSGCGVTDTPEPVTPLLLFPAVIAVLLKVGRVRKTIKARDGCTARTHPQVPAGCSPERRKMASPLPRPR
jgi:hypothetical protein